MKINRILLTMSCFIIINADIVYPQTNSNISVTDRNKIKELLKDERIVPPDEKSETVESEMEFRDGLFIYTKEDEISKPLSDEMQYYGYIFFKTSLDRKIWDNKCKTYLSY